jgi:hypothetical protein
MGRVRRPWDVSGADTTHQEVLFQVEKTLTALPQEVHGSRTTTHGKEVDCTTKGG